LLIEGVMPTLASAQKRPAPSAQARPSPSRDRFEVSVGGLWIGGTDLGALDANLRANNLTPTPFRLFSTQTSQAGAPGIDLRFGYWLSRSLAVEGGFARMQPELRTRVIADAESAPALTAAERIDQYFIDANVVWSLDRFRFRGMVPFVAGGAGYLRQLHEGRTLVETGQVYEAGGGIRYPIFRNVGWFRTIGLRLYGRACVLVDGIQLEDQPRTHGAFSASGFLTF